MSRITLSPHSEVAKLQEGSGLQVQGVQGGSGGLALGLQG